MFASLKKPVTVKVEPANSATCVVCSPVSGSKQNSELNLLSLLLQINRVYVLEAMYTLIKTNTCLFLFTKEQPICGVHAFNHL